MNIPLGSSTPVCTKSVSNHTGFHFRPCKKPAKYLVTYDDGHEPKYRCGIHARNLRPFETRVPVKP